MPFQGFPTRALTGIPPGLLSRASPNRSRRNKVGPRPRVSIGSHLASSVLAGEPAEMHETTLLGFSHLSGPEHSDAQPPGLCVHLMLCRALLPTSQQSLRGPNALPGLFGFGGGAEPSRPHVRCGEKLVGSFRVFESAARDASVAAGESSSCEVGVSFRVFDPSRYRPHWLGAPALPLAVASTLRFSLVGPRRSTIKPICRILSSGSPPR